MTATLFCRHCPILIWKGPAMIFASDKLVRNPKYLYEQQKIIRDLYFLLFPITIWKNRITASYFCCFKLNQSCSFERMSRSWNAQIPSKIRKAIGSPKPYNCFHNINWNWLAWLKMLNREKFCFLFSSTFWFWGQNFRLRIIWLYKTKK